MQRRQIIQWGAASLAAPAITARAQSFPAKPIKLVIAFPAGGPTDITMRVLADNASKILGQPVIVENKPGAGGTLPAQQLQTSPADGYTLAQIPLGVFRLPYTTKINWDPVKDISYVINVTGYAFGIVVPADSPLKNWQDFVAYAKANPGKLAFGHGSSGSLVSAAMLTELAGLQTVNVPYKSIPPALTDLLGGQIQFAFADTGNAVAQMNGGRMRGLGVTTKKRAGKAPNVPPIGETVKDYNVSAWFGLMAPAGIPADVQKKATATLMAVLAKPDVREKIQGVGIDLDVEDSATLAKTIDAEIKKWGGWVKTAGITPE